MFPPVLLELGFLSNTEDEKLLLDQAWRDKIGNPVDGSGEEIRASAGGQGG